MQSVTSFLAVKTTQPLSLSMLSFFLCTLGILLFIKSNTKSNTFSYENYQFRYRLRNYGILVCPTVVTESFSMETVFMLNHWRIIWTHCNRFYRKKVVQMMTCQLWSFSKDDLASSWIWYFLLSLGANQRDLSCISNPSHDEKRVPLHQHYEHGFKFPLIHSNR